MPSRLNLLASLTLALAFSPAVARGQAFTRLIDFGDSLSDVGNANSLTFGIAPGSNYYNGRYSNGPLWDEDVAVSLNLGAIAASRKGGLDFATGGSHTGSGSVSPFPGINLPNAGTQIESYLGKNTPGADDLVTLWTGANDFIDGQTDPTVPAANVKAHVQRLIDAGVKNLLVINLPPLGETPRYRTTADRATMDSRASQFNALVSSGLDAIGAASPGATIYRADMPTLFANVFANPSAYGFTNVTDPALQSNGTVVANPDQYLFYDDIHPTRVGHMAVANVAFEAVTTRTWAAGASTHAWASAGNWTQHRIPDATSAVQLSGGSFEVALGGNASVRRVTIGDGSAATPTLDLGTSTLAVSDSLTLNGGRLAVSLSASVDGHANVGGAATLNGTIAVRFVDGYIGLPGRTATLLTYASESGTPTFANETSYAGLSFVPTLGATSLAIRLSATDGDADLNASVDFTDLLTLGRHYGQVSNASWLDGDFTGDAAVNFNDLLALAKDYCTSRTNAAPASTSQFASDWALAQSLAPEPALAACIGAGVIMSVRRRSAGSRSASAQQKPSAVPRV